jgi:hypothetical protein
VLAGEDMVRTLESALRQMAMLSRVALSGGVSEQVVRPVRGFRVQIFQDLASTMRMHGEAQFEPGAATAEHRAQQQRLLGLLQDAQQVFLIVAGFVRNRLNVALKQIDSPARQQVHEVAVAVGTSLDAAADRLAGRTPRAAPSLRALVEAAESYLTHATAATAAVPASSLADLRAQLELYRSLVPLIESLTAHADAVQASVARARSLASP